MGWPPSPVITGRGTLFLDANPVRYKYLSDDILEINELHMKKKNLSKTHERL